MLRNKQKPPQLKTTQNVLCKIFKVTITPIITQLINIYIDRTHVSSFSSADCLAQRLRSNFTNSAQEKGSSFLVNFENVFDLKKNLGFAKFTKKDLAFY